MLRARMGKQRVEEPESGALAPPGTVALSTKTLRPLPEAVKARSLSIAHFDHNV